MSGEAEAPKTGKIYHIPGEPGVWVLIFGDMMIFTMFLLSPVAARFVFAFLLTFPIIT